ncbi:hypothetical protein RND81_03G004400 [Saponaria officinalis]|uniref:Uncharacterized protein n=1 Tax=Saponaria officinalis TaxID=3572 RepID=A0AAW1M3I2_SAPOF
MSIMYLLFHLILLLSIISPSLTQPNIIKTLPGYPGDIPFTLETGYVKVGETEQIQLFYYFIESERDVGSDPLMLWLTGGPGCSAFSGLLFEIGPLQLNLSASNSESEIPRLQQNPYSWTKVASIIFLDSPVGTGFSYATSSEAYYSSDTLQSSHVYEFLRKWLINHPKFNKNPLYISGDSYSGIIVPIVVQNILKGNEIEHRPKLNLKGYVLGNPAMTQDRQTNYRFANRVSLLSDELYKSAMISCNGDFSNVDAKNTMCLKHLQAMNKDVRLVNQPHVLEHNCLFVSPKHSPDNAQATNPFRVQAEFCRNQHYLLAYTWADDKNVRKALHIKEGSIDHWVRCNHSLAYEKDVNSSVDYNFNVLKNSLQVLIYSGDQDLVVPYFNTLEWIKQLNIPISDEWRPWFVDGQVAGYVTEFSSLPYRLVHTTIKGGGHTAPEYKPRECLAMIDRWFSLSPL